MPHASWETASDTIALEGLEVRLEHLEGGYSVRFESHSADADLASLFRGLHDDRAQLPRQVTPRSTTREPRSSSSAPPRSSARRSRW